MRYINLRLTYLLTKRKKVADDTIIPFIFFPGKACEKSLWMIFVYYTVFRNKNTHFCFLA